MTERASISAERSEWIEDEAKRFGAFIVEFPWGLWRFENGSEVLFNADHCPLLYKSPLGLIGPAGEVAWASWQLEVWFWHRDQLLEWDWDELIAHVNSRVAHWGVVFSGFGWWH